jgi:SMC interacting uncharacterized protein involved in chromosome segregation
MTDFFNKLINDSYAILALIFIAISAYLKQFLCWCGRKVAEGAINDFIEKLMPKLEEKIDRKFKPLRDEIKSMDRDIKQLKEIFPAYQGEKHFVEGELRQLKDAIMNEDEEALEVIRKHYAEKEKNINLKI